MRWLPQANAAGAANCIDGVLHGFQDIGAITPNSFASVVDAEILCDFANGLHGALFPSDFNDINPAAQRWLEFFMHQRDLASADQAWTDASTVLWAKAEQRATELGYQWAVDRRADPTDALAAMASLSELYRWINRRRGKDSDPLRSVAGHVSMATSVPASAVYRDVSWLFDPHNRDFTYVGVVAVDALVRHLDPAAVVPETRAALRRWHDVIEILPPKVRSWITQTTNEPHVLTAREFQQVAAVERSTIQSFSWAFTLDNNLRDARCNVPLNNSPECV